MFLPPVRGCTIMAARGIEEGGCADGHLPRRIYGLGGEEQKRLRKEEERKGFGRPAPPLPPSVAVYSIGLERGGRKSGVVATAFCGTDVSLLRLINGLFLFFRRGKNLMAPLFSFHFRPSLLTQTVEEMEKVEQKEKERAVAGFCCCCKCTGSSVS